MAENQSTVVIVEVALEIPNGMGTVQTCFDLAEDGVRGAVEGKLGKSVLRVRAEQIMNREQYDMDVAAEAIGGTSDDAPEKAGD